MCYQFLFVLAMVIKSILIFTAQYYELDQSISVLGVLGSKVLFHSKSETPKMGFVATRPICKINHPKCLNQYHARIQKAESFVRGSESGRAGSHSDNVYSANL